MPPSHVAVILHSYGSPIYTLHCRSSSVAAKTPFMWQPLLLSSAQCGYHSSVVTATHPHHQSEVATPCLWSLRLHIRGCYSSSVVTTPHPWSFSSMVATPRLLQSPHLLIFAPEPSLSVVATTPYLWLPPLLFSGHHSYSTVVATPTQRWSPLLLNGGRHSFSTVVATPPQKWSPLLSTMVAIALRFESPKSSFSTATPVVVAEIAIATTLFD